MQAEMKQDVPKFGSGPSLGSEVVRIMVGPRQREFKVHSQLLCSASRYFCERLNATSKPADATGAMLWLSTEAPEMFELFVVWLYQRPAFRAYMEAAIAQVDPDSCSAAVSESCHETSRRALHWSLVGLHLFAAKTSMPALQDAAMDALQDLYLRCDWEVSPWFVRFLYADCYAEHAFRIRKWAVAMVAWTVAMQGGEPTEDFQRLLKNHPTLDHDYSSHLRKMAGSRGASLCVKNPQLRLPANRLKSEERFFGFRQCSFHSHRSAVGEGPCPHEAACIHVRKTAAFPCLPASAPRRRANMKDEMESDGSDHGFMSPVSVYIRRGFYLDLS